ncbi:MAG: hypothetical protein ACRCXZ_04655, partial [Patescibacteria group bacterium]
AFDPSKIDGKYMNNYYDDVYFATSTFSESQVLITAKPNLDYIKTFENQSIDQYNYDKIINSIIPKKESDKNVGESINQQIINDYSLQKSRIKFKKDCFGDFYLESSHLKKPYFQSLTEQDGQVLISALSHNQNDFIEYEIEYDTCHLWGLKKDTINKTGQIKLDRIDLRVNKEEVSFWDSIIASQEIKEDNSQLVNLQKNLLENGSKIYLTQEIIGKIETNLEQYGPTRLLFKVVSQPSKIKSLPIFTPASLLNSIGLGFVNSLSSIKDKVLAPFHYFRIKGYNQPTFAKDVINSLAIFTVLMLGVSLFFLILASLLALSRLAVRKAQFLKRISTILLVVALLIG